MIACAMLIAFTSCNDYLDKIPDTRVYLENVEQLRQLYINNYIGWGYNAYNYSTARIADGGFIRLKEVALTYNIPMSFLRHLRLTSASVKLAATNISLLYADKKLNGADPEFFNSGGVASPNPKQFTFTLRFGL